MPASYNIVPVLQTPNINPGDTVRIEIYISGAGNTGRKRLHILHPYPDLFQQDVGTISLGIAQVPAEEVNDEETIIHGEGEKKAATEVDSGYIGRPHEEAPEEYRVVHELDIVATAIAIPDWFFEPIPESLVGGTESGHGEAPPSFQVKFTEGKFGEKAPWVMELNISEDAKPGDYKLDFIFTYETEVIKSSRRSVQLHVNDWIEKRQPNLKRIVVAIALLSLLSQAIDPASVIDLLSSFISGLS